MKSRAEGLLYREVSILAPTPRHRYSGIWHGALAASFELYPAAAIETTYAVNHWLNEAP